MFVCRFVLPKYVLGVCFNDYFHKMFSSAIVGLESTRCEENVYVQEMKVEISELKESLNFTRYQFDELRSELRRQKSLANLTSQVFLHSLRLHGKGSYWYGLLESKEKTGG